MSRLAQVTISIVITVFALVLSACDVSNLPRDAQISVVRLSPEFASDRTMFLGTIEDGVYRSEDGGKSWQNVADELGRTTAQGDIQNVPVVDLGISPNFSVDNTVFFGTELGLYRSTDAGDNWTLLEDTAFDHTVAITFSPRYAQDRTLFVTATKRTFRPDTLLWRSLDGGDSWEQVSGTPRIHFLNDGSIAGATPRRVSRSADLGEHWEKLFSSDSVDPNGFGGFISFSPDFPRDGIAFWADCCSVADAKR